MMHRHITKRKGTRMKSLNTRTSITARRRKPRKVVVPAKIKQYLLKLIEDSLLTPVERKSLEPENSFSNFYNKKWPSEFSTDRRFKENRSYVQKTKEDINAEEEIKTEQDIATHGKEFDIFLLDNTDGCIVPSCEANEVAEFCKGALAAHLQTGVGTAGQRRAIWLDDRSSSVSPRGQTVREYKNPLTATGLHRALQEPRFGNGDEPDADRRLVYLENLDPYCILALAKNASFHQVSVLRDAIWKHLAIQCSIQVKIPGRAFPIFQLELHIPYFCLRATGPPNMHRRGAIQTTPPRKWIDLAFLKIRTLESEDHQTYGLHESHISFVICGSDNSRWAGYSFADNITDETLEDEAFSYEGFHGDPISSAELDSNIPLWDPREYFLTIVEIRLRRILKEWKYLIRTVACSIEDYKTRHPSNLSPHSRSTGVRAKDIKKTFDWTQQTMDLLSRLLNRLSETLRTFRTFNSPKGDIGYFLDSSSNVLQRRTDSSLRTIREILEELECLQQQLLLLEKSCLSSAQALQLRLTLEGNEAVQNSGRATELTVSILSPFAVATGSFAMPRSVLPFTPNLKTFIIAIMILMAMVRLILFALPRQSWWWKKSRAWIKTLHLDGLGRPISAIEYMNWLPGRTRLDPSHNAIEGVDVATIGV